MTADQPGLFDPPPAARATDPATSWDAAHAQAQRAPRIREHVLDTIRHHWPHRKGFTHQDLVYAYQRRARRGTVPPATESSIRTRCSELVRAGLVEDSGQRHLVAGRRAMTLWRLA